MTGTGGDRPAEPAVSAALSALDRLADTPVPEHVAIFERVLGDLEAALGLAGEAAPRPQQ